MEKHNISMATLLRLKAERIMKDRPAEEASIHNEGDILKLLHELEVYSVELEIQNEELLNATANSEELAKKNKLTEHIKQRLIHEFELNQIELEVQNEELMLSNTISHDIAERYSDLFNFSSSGYLILSKEGEILDLNFSGARLLGKERLKLKNSLFGFFISEYDRSTYNDFLTDLFNHKNRLSCEASLALENSKSTNVLLSGILTQNENQCLITILDITERKQISKYRELTREILQVVIEPGDIKGLLHRALGIIKERTGFDAVGIRLQDGIDFPYADQAGFSRDFILEENSLIELDKKGKVCRDKNGDIRLSCTCGLVVSGKADPNDPHITPGGSWWTNDSAPILTIPTDKDARYHPRNLCIHKGYSSIALVPIRNNEKIIGLIQFNDYRKDVFNLNKIEYLEGIAMHIGAALMRKQAEETLRKNEELLRTITLNAPDIILQLDRNGIIQYMNRPMPGNSMDQCLGQNFCDWTLPEYHDLMNQSLLQVFEDSSTQTYLSKGSDLNGDTRWYRSSISPVIEGEVVEKAILITRDITNSMLAEEILRESEEKRKTILMTAMDGFWISDRQGNILEVNDAYSKMSGYSRQELLTMRIQELEVEESPEETKVHMQRLIKLGEERFETRHRCKDGSIIHVDASVQYKKIQGGVFIAFLHNITSRIQREKAMFERNEQFRLLFENSLDAILFTNPDGTVNSVNPEAERMLGRSKEEISGLDREDIADKNDPRLPLALEQRNKTGFFKGELTYLRKDGTPFPVEITSTLFRDSNNIERTSIIARDISERKNAEEALRINNVRLNLAMSVANMAWWEMDVTTGNITFEDRKAEMLGFRATEFTHYTDFMKLVHPEDAERAMDAMRKHIYGSEDKYETEYRILSKSGEYKWFYDIGSVTSWNEKGESITVNGVVIDITDRKEAEEALAASENEFRLLTESMPQIVWTTTADGLNTYFNHQWVEYTGLTLQESYGHGWNIPFHPEDQQRAWDAWQNAVLHNADYLLQCRLRRFDGVYRWWLLHGVPVIDKNGTITKWYGTCTDIDEMKNAGDAILHNEMLLRSVIENVSSGVALVDETGKFVVYNPVFLKLFGLSLDSTIKNVNDQDWSQWQVFDENKNLLHVDDHPVRKAVMTKKLVKNQLVAMKLPTGGDYIWMMISAEPLLKEDGSIDKIICTYHDITERKLAEEAILVSEERFRTMANAIPQLAWIAHADGFIYWYNQRWYDYTGTTPDQMEGWGWQQVHDPELLPSVMERWKKSIETGESFDMEFPLRGADGIYRTFLTLVMPLKDSEGRIIQWFGTNTDVTESKRAEQELRESEQRYKSLFRDNHSVMLLIHPQTGAIVDANPTACTYYGWSKAELCTRNIADINTLSNQEIAAEMQHAKEEQRNHFFFRHLLATNEIRDVEVYSGPIQFGNETLLYSLVHDITDRKKAEAGLQKSKDNLRAILDATLESIYLFDKEGSVVDANLTAATRLKKEIEAIKGQKLSALIPNGILQTRLTHLKEVFDTGKSVQFEDKRDEYNFEHSFFPIFNQGKVENVVSFTRDITSQKQANEAIINSERKLSEIYASMSEGLAVHELIYDASGKAIDYVITEVNPAYEKITGITRNDVIDRKASDIYSIGQAPYLDIYSEVESTGNSTSFETYFEQMNKHFSISVFSPGKGRFVTVFRDVTEQKQAEEALLQSESRYRSMFQENQSTLLILDPDSGAIKDANQAACDFYGWPYEVMCNMNISEINPLPQDQISINLINSKEFNNNHLFFKHKLASGELRDVEIYSGPLKFGESTLIYTIIHDITEQKQTEEALRASEHRLDAVFNSVTETIMMLDTEGVILAANNTAASRWNMTAEEMTGNNMFELVPSELRKIRNEQIKELTESGNAIRFEEHLNEQVFDITFYPISDTSGNINQFVVFNRDITEKRRAQELLRANEERYSLIYNSSRDSVFSFDLSGRITSANRSFCDEVKLDVTDILGNTFSGLGLPEILTREKENLTNKVIDTNNTVISELKIPTAEGPVRYYEITLNPMHDGNGNIIGIGGSARNITKRKEASQALMESEKRFRYMVKDIPVGIIQFDSTGEVLMSNPKAVELLQQNDEQIKKKYSTEEDWSTIREDGSPYPKEERPIPKTFSTGQQQKGVVIGVYREATSDYVWLLIDTVIVLKDDGTIRNVVGTFIDITGIKKAEKALKESEEKFRNLVWDMQVGVLLQGPRAEIFMSNPKALELLGLTEDQLLGKTSFDPDWNVIHEDGTPFPGETHPVAVALATGLQVQNVVMGVYNPIIGDRVWLMVHAVPETGVDGKIQQVVCTFIDISELKNTQQELRESEFFFRESQQAGFIGSYKTDFSTGKWESSEVLDQIFGIDKTYNRSVEGWLNIAHPDDRDMMNHYLLQEVLMKGSSFNKEYRIIRKNDNITRWVLGLGRVDFDSDNSVKSLVGTIQDITERKAKEEALRKLNQTLAALSKSSQIMSQSEDEADYLKQVCHIVVDDTDFAMVWIGYALEDEAKSILPVASAGFDDDYLDTIKVSWGNNEYGRGPTGKAIRSGQVEMCSNMHTDPGFEPWREQALKRGFASSIVFPLKNGDKTFGAITIYSKEPDSFLKDELKLLSKLASDLAHGITTIRLRAAHKLAAEALKKSHSELEIQVKERTAKLVELNESLKITEEKYRTVSDFATNWEFWIGPGEEMIYCSPSSERITGFSATELTLHSNLIYDIIHPDDLTDFREHRKKELKADKCDHEIQYRIFKKDGSMRWIGHFCRPVYDETGIFKGTRTSNKDITARKKMEELLITSNQKYKLLSENITDGIFICKNGKFEYINKAICDIFGYSSKELTGMKLTQLVLADYHEELENFLYASPDTNQSCEIEVECMRNDFTIVYVEVLLSYSTREKTVYGVVHDITEKKEFQKNMVKAIIQTEEKERANFSKELHDGLGPLLSTIKLYLQWSERPNSKSSRVEIVSKAGEILEEALSAVKEISNKLSPHLLINYGLNSAIKSFVDKLSATATYNIVFESNSTRRFDENVEASLYRAIIECINNTLKYAHASNILIHLNDTGSQIQLRYMDNGVGFDIKETIGEHKGLGLFNLQNRLHTIGGKVELKSEPGNGVDYLFTVNV